MYFHSSLHANPVVSLTRGHGSRRRGGQSSQSAQNRAGGESTADTELWRPAEGPPPSPNSPTLPKSSVDTCENTTQGWGKDHPTEAEGKLPGPDHPAWTNPTMKKVCVVLRGQYFHSGANSARDGRQLCSHLARLQSQPQRIKLSLSNLTVS